jgi:predicted dehydrogenase
LGLLQKEPLPPNLVRIVAGYDLIAERAHSLAKMFPGTRVYTTYRQMIEDPQVELIVVSTRSHEHAPMSIAAMRGSKDVLVEKPIATTLRDADRMIKVARETGQRLLVRQNRRFDPHFLHARELIQSGKLGKVFSISLRQHGYQHRADWQTLRKYGGGQLLNWGPHVVDWGMRLLGSPAVDVWSDLKRIASAGDAEDHVKLIIRGENGCVLDIEISTAAAIGGASVHILGEYGALLLQGGKWHMRRLSARSVREMKRVKADELTHQPGYVSPVQLQWIDEQFPVAPKKTYSFWRELHKTLKKGSNFPISLQEVRDNLRILELARKGTPFSMR